LANDSDFGLGGSVFTQDIERENELQIKLILEWYLSITQHGHKLIYPLAEPKDRLW
jgi:hypothetical protein